MSGLALTPGAHLADFDRPAVMRQLVEEALASPAVWLGPAYLPLLYARWLMLNAGLWDGCPGAGRAHQNPRAGEPWTARDDAIASGVASPRIASRVLGRSLSAVQTRRCSLRRSEGSHESP